MDLGLVRKTMNRLTFDEAEDDLPVWTPDGEKIAFASLREESGIYWKSADGAGNAERLAPMGDKILYSHTWSSDGKTLIVTSDKGSALLDIEYLSLEGDREVKPLLYEHYQEQYPRLSPDGRWIAYTSMETGQWEVYIRSFPDVNRMKRKVSTDGGGEPVLPYCESGQLPTDGCFSENGTSLPARDTQNPFSKHGQQADQLLNL